MIFVLLAREIHAALVNRLVLFFGGLMLLLGFLPLILTNDAASLSDHILVMSSLLWGAWKLERAEP